MKGRDRNRQCPCGSGKKWKKCHPDKKNLADIQGIILQHIKI